MPPTRAGPRHVPNRKLCPPPTRSARDPTSSAQRCKTPHTEMGPFKPAISPSAMDRARTGFGLPFAAGSMTHITSPPSRPCAPSQLLLHLAFPAFPELHPHRTDNPPLTSTQRTLPRTPPNARTSDLSQPTRRQPREALTTIGHTSGTSGFLSGMVPRPGGMPYGSVGSRPTPTTRE